MHHYLARRPRGSTLIELIIMVMIIGILAVIVVGGGRGRYAGIFGAAWEESFATITVMDKYPLRGEGATIYRIDAEEETFQIVDSFLEGQYNSADLFRNMKKDCTYEVRCRGFRSGRWSQFRNIVEIVREIEE